LLHIQPGWQFQGRIGTYARTLTVAAPMRFSESLSHDEHFVAEGECR
jgi:hypothetical protein